MSNPKNSRPEIRALKVGDSVFVIHSPTGNIAPGEVTAIRADGALIIWWCWGSWDGTRPFSRHTGAEKRLRGDNFWDYNPCHYILIPKEDTP